MRPDELLEVRELPDLVSKILTKLFERWARMLDSGSSQALENGGRLGD